MRHSLPSFFRLSLATVLSAGSLLHSQSPAAVSEAQTACAGDIQKLCAGVPSGGGRILACLKQHQDQVSAACKQAVIKALQPSQAAPTPAPAATPPVAPANSAPSAAEPKKISPAPSGTPHYFVMKQVKIIDQGMGQGRPAYDLLIPSDWDFKGWVNVGVADGGCTADWFSVFGDATSPDKSVEFQLLPQSTWQYMDDPMGQKQMQEQNQRDAQVKMKLCPVLPPMHAEEFIRQNMLPRAPKGSTVGAIEPFPELAESVRHQLGLPPASAGGNTAGIRIDAARARISYTDETGKPAEGFVSTAVVVRSIPASRGSAYDCRAVMSMFFRAPKGQLDANDRLFKLIAATVHPEAEWSSFSNGIIATIYHKKQLEAAKQSAMISDFQKHVADTINGVVANSQAGANRAVFGESQIIRGVQTFRDPSTGNTFELSNQYDHAWLNGANQYVMTDDSTFDPNSQLTGNWTKLELVRQQP